MRVLVVVDMQKDFVSGALGTPEAVEIVPRVTAVSYTHLVAISTAIGLLSHP